MLISLGLNFDHVRIEFDHDGINGDIMTYVLVLSVKVRRNEWLWQTLDVGNMFVPTFGFKTSR